MKSIDRILIALALLGARILIVLALFGTLVYTNPSMDQYKAFVQQKINEVARKEGAEGFAILFGGLASEFIINRTVRRDYVVISTYDTEFRKNEYFFSVGILKNFITLDAPPSLLANNSDNRRSKISDSKEIFMDSLPQPNQAFQALYKTSVPLAEHILDSNQHASVWFLQQFNDGEFEFFTLFTQVKELENKGEAVDCHACTVSIDAITYIHKEKGWTIESTQRDIIKIGIYGEAPKLSSAKVLLLSPGNVVLAIPQSDSGQGITGRGEYLLNHFQGRWRDIGYLELAGDNSGTICYKKGAKPARTEEQYAGECYAYSSSYSLIKGDSLTYPQILVRRKGSEFPEELDHVAPVKDEIYSFNGTKYESPRQKARAAQAEEDARSQATESASPTATK